MELVTSHQNKSAQQLYRVLSSAETGNVFLSPFSISTALAMVWGGAAGNTALQMKTALALGDDAVALHEGYSQLLTRLQDPPNITLSTANRLYVQDAYSILASYSELLKEKYLTELKSVDFADATGTSKLINYEVDTLTKGKIKDLIDSSALDSMTRAVLVNAIYFKGSWKHPFDKESTSQRDFFVEEGTAVKTDMMFMDGKKFNGGVLEDLKCKALELPYEGGRFSMLMLLPDDKDGLKTMEEKLAGTTIESIRNKLTNRESMIIMPKFKLETSYDLEDHLKALGISDLFEESIADLSNISGQKDLFVSKVVHKAFVEVNEEGSEAAAATGIAMATFSMPMDLLEFVADHPFFFAMLDNETGLVLFSGRYGRPE